jgi:hypothetical protein
MFPFSRAINRLVLTKTGRNITPGGGTAIRKVRWKGKREGWLHGVVLERNGVHFDLFYFSLFGIIEPVNENKTLWPKEIDRFPYFDLPLAARMV